MEEEMQSIANCINREVNAVSQPLVTVYRPAALFDCVCRQLGLNKEGNSSIQFSVCQTVYNWHSKTLVFSSCKNTVTV
jgi:hypothetical protein